VFRRLVEDAGLARHFEIESAGTAAYHAGEPPDERSAATASTRGYTLGGRARQFERADFARFDYVLAMDRSNLAKLVALADGNASNLFLLREFDSASPEGSEVPDPYYGGADGFDRVLDICEAACAGLLAAIRQRHRLD
jgi:protein-tyrosine phosphatase